MNIYLIEDDAIYAQFIRRALENSSPKYKIRSFTSAEDALKNLNDALPDAMIVDYNLPGMTGIDFYETIKSRITDHNKVIILSALDDGNLVLSFIQKGVRDYIIKDESVIESLTAVLNGKENDYSFLS